MSTQEHKDRFYAFAEFAKRRVTMDGYPTFSAQDAWNAAWLAAETATIERAWKAVHAERLEDPTENHGDMAYERAISDCENAILALIPKEG